MGRLQDKMGISMTTVTGSSEAGDSTGLEKVGSQGVRSPMPDLTPHAELALFARALHREGWDDGEVGHIMYRQPDGTFLTLPYELGWDEVRPEDILRIDMDGNELEGNQIKGIRTVPSTILLHLEFHRARPGCNVTVHQHPRFATIWSALGRIPPVYDQRSALVPDEDIVFYDDYRGGVNDLDAARDAVAGIGMGTCAILRNHGAFVVADSIVQAFTRATTLEWRCKQAWHVDAIGGGKAMPQHGREWLAETFVAVGGVARTHWPWAVRRELRADPSLLGYHASLGSRASGSRADVAVAAGTTQGGSE